ncbi:uncharacterized protein BXZ73DRAFT_44055 [Epithele typhae]|uniref:uncharacterized protein n=1 Tax=Epithele typhae TaxID=378194 RepID=UPI00200845C2|nr:uncharacterized protein BXZ73DRAFT_44055 [Epithele typhae]KAH9939091.1 hypothetical protein BXZ73DRAFT_44055 [Epithele typhae]
MAAEAAASELVLHTISGPEDPRLPAVLALSNAIFNSDPASKHGSLDAWRERLANPISQIVFLAPSTAPSEDETAIRPVGFLFVIPRATEPPLNNGVVHSAHVWIAGVRPEWRRGGCLATMVDALDRFEHLTLCTFPARFPDMWAWLNRRGWVQERELGDGKILLSRSKKLP